MHWLAGFMPLWDRGISCLCGGKHLPVLGGDYSECERVDCPRSQLGDGSWHKALPKLQELNGRGLMRRRYPDIDLNDVIEAVFGRGAAGEWRYHSYQRAHLHEARGGHHAASNEASPASTSEDKTPEITAGPGPAVTGLPSMALQAMPADVGMPALELCRLYPWLYKVHNPPRGRTAVAGATTFASSRYHRLPTIIGVRRHRLPRRPPSAFLVGGHCLPQLRHCDTHRSYVLFTLRGQRRAWGTTRRWVPINL